MPSEQEALQALINRIQGEITALDARLRELKLLQHSARELAGFSRGVRISPDEPALPVSHDASAPKGLVAGLVREYVRQHERFTTSEIVDHVLDDNRISRSRRHVYSAVYETLRRLAQTEKAMGWIKETPITSDNPQEVANHGK